ncbi:flagellar basal body rod protein [Bacillus sp. REN10]|uniref:lmo0954 family membrane protein n=1 Tax=Bacillus sp. REN10 TaxID=2782541 RepID=UPI00193C589B|nr:flagellar basal body rod protein [Bacillus sp. REN10]
MKKVMLFCIGGLAAIIAAASLGPVIALVICAGIMYVAWTQFQKSPSKMTKAFWGMAGLIAFFVAVGNVPALLGVGALVVLYMVYKKWNEEELVEVEKETDPFVNFEREWKQLMK